MRKDSEIRAARGEFLRPLYHAHGPINVRVEAERTVYTRGVTTVEGEAEDAWVYERLAVLLRWHGWLQKARLGTLRWLAAQEGQLSAGSLRTTAAVRSQLFGAGLARSSDLWGDEITSDGYRLALWAAFEVDRRHG